ncbi:MAG TPA: 50S ribosomal protein L2 [Candidatus Saccharimonadia bacterium]|nr:50S ribosomal protein L2 [Candidatus Saccharimonadia bacterium]
MAIKYYKPTTPGRRGMTTADTEMLAKKRPEKSLIVAKKTGSGRNNQGKITVRHRGGGVKRFYRLVDFDFTSVKSAVVEALEYDPNRSAHIALVRIEGGKLAYVLAGSGMKVGDQLASGEEAPIRTGNRLPLKNIPAGTQIYNIELVLGKGGQIARSAGTKASLVSRESSREGFVQVKLPSGELRLVNENCQATIGTVGNEQHQNIKYGTAGRKRRLGWRPAVRGSAMNPVDHPHGGGEGAQATSIYKYGQKTPWGKPALGLKTRRRKSTNAMIIRGRGKGRRK